MIKHSIRYFNDTAVRAIWDNKNNKWWYSAIDVLLSLTNSSNPRIYWNAIKRRNPELNSFCYQQKLYADDGKKYLSDVIDENGIKKLLFVLPSRNKEAFQKWIVGLLDPVDEQSKRKAYDFYQTNLIEDEEIGKTISLLKIHGYLFEGLYPFAGQIRTRTISKGGFTFANGDYLPTVLKDIDKMADSSLEEIVYKYIEMNIAHPFMEGNGRATRIWLDLLLKARLQKCIDWSEIEKVDYMFAMKESPVNAKPLFNLLNNALTDDINNREIFMKGIDCSYYYEEEE